MCLKNIGDKACWPGLRLAPLLPSAHDLDFRYRGDSGGVYPGLGVGASGDDKIWSGPCLIAGKDSIKWAAHVTPY